MALIKLGLVIILIASMAGISGHVSPAHAQTTPQEQGGKQETTPWGCSYSDRSLLSGLASVVALVAPLALIVVQRRIGRSTDYLPFTTTTQRPEPHIIQDSQSLDSEPINVLRQHIARRGNLSDSSE